MFRSSIHMPSFLSHDRSGGRLFPSTPLYWKPPDGTDTATASVFVLPAGRLKVRLGSPASQSQGSTGRDLAVLCPSLELKSVANKTKEEHRWLKPKPSAGTQQDDRET